MSDELHQERRVDAVTVKVATLEERSLAHSATLARIENNFDSFVKEDKEWKRLHSDEEKEFRDEEKEFRETVLALLNKHKGAFFVVTFFLTSIVTFFNIFWDSIRSAFKA